MKIENNDNSFDNYEPQLNKTNNHALQILSVIFFTVLKEDTI